MEGTPRLYGTLEQVLRQHQIASRLTVRLGSPVAPGESPEDRDLRAALPFDRRLSPPSDRKLLWGSFVQINSLTADSSYSWSQFLCG
jgi:hypothetical protein